MNIQEYDLMNILKDKPYENQRTLSEQTGYSLGKVNASLKTLISHHYLDKQMQFTELAREEFKKKKPENAIILAAGFDMHMVPLNTMVPKGLLEVQGTPLVETMIQYLHEVGITQIDIVVGFLKESYEYLIDEYHVNLVYTKDYLSRNNLYSLKCVMNKICNTYIIPCDIWCPHNPFADQELYSWYMVTDKETIDSSVRIGRKRELVLVRNDEMGNRMIGIAYILGEDAGFLKQRINELSQRREFYQAFWEEAVVQDGKMILFPRVVKDRDAYEIDSIEGLREANEGPDPFDKEIYQIITVVLKCHIQDISDIKALRKGVLDDSYEFSCKGMEYLIRVPGKRNADSEGWDRIEAAKEYAVCQKLKEYKIDDLVIYISDVNGYRISKCREDSRTCDPTNKEEVRRCIQYLKKIHELDIQVDHTYDLFHEMEYLETFQYNRQSVYRDYHKTKEKMYELKRYVDRQPRHFALAHINPIPDNFILSGENMYLVNWEYAGMQDVHVDIAMFAIYAGYNKEQIDWLIDCYFEGNCMNEVRLKIYCYVAISGFLWSNWCEYKRSRGVEFDEYSLKQYRYAKEYYTIVKEELEHE